ncbi:hypothetical protein [Gaoshiqia sp. Z1-71]|uniref:hypothetical protein n=1 Tax=Gaoshiqia hydrogeniformans TaxID=3290090 RepID=UPI003BF7A56A
MPDEQLILDQLRKIVESRPFSRSGVNVSLLNLLVNSTLEGIKLKETTIGSEIFGKAYDPVRNDTKVRVYVHNLRKKLEVYYATDGKGDEIIFEIEKGQYQVSFSGRETRKSVFTKRRTVFVLVILLMLILSVILIKTAGQKQNGGFWDGFVAENYPLTVLIGDHFTISSSLPTGGSGIIRDFSINSEQEFARHIQQHPDQAVGMIPNRYPYITKMGPYCTKMISELLSRNHRSFNLMLNSEWDKSKVNSENIIYIGQFKTMGFLRNVFSNAFPNIEISGSRLKITDPVSEEVKLYNSQGEPQMVDYTIVSKMRGPNGTDMALFISDNDIGVIRVVEYLTNPDSLAGFYARNQLYKHEFTALFKVSGWERTDYAMELVTIARK